MNASPDSSSQLPVKVPPRLHGFKLIVAADVRTSVGVRHAYNTLLERPLWSEERLAQPVAEVDWRPARVNAAMLREVGRVLFAFNAGGK